MELLMNGQVVDFKFDTEKSIVDIGESMSTWASKRDLIFTGLLVDGHFYGSNELPDLAIEKVSICDLTIQSRADLIITSLGEGSAYCDRVIEYISECDTGECFQLDELESFYAGIDWLIDVTTSVFSMLELDVSDIRHLDRSVAEYLADITSLAKELRAVDGEKSHDKLLSILQDQKQLFTLFKGIFKMALLSDNIKAMVVRSIDSPDALIQSLIDSKAELPNQLNNLEKISEAFQSGRDEEASELLHPFLDFMYTYSRSSIQSAPVFSIDPEELMVDGVSITEKNRQISELLAEVVEVMESDDIISASDILEYELKPALESVPLYIDAILKKLGL